MRGTLAGFLKSVLSGALENFVWREEHIMKPLSILHDGKGLILHQFLNVNHLGGGLESMLPQEGLKPISSEIA